MNLETTECKLLIMTGQAQSQCSSAKVPVRTISTVYLIICVLEILCAILCQLCTECTAKNKAINLAMFDFQGLY